VPGTQEGQAGLASEADGTVVGQTALTSAQAAEVRALAALCNAHDDLDLKLTIEVSDDEEPAAEPAQAFLCHENGALVGYAALDHGGSSEAELCGMVHPAARHCGTGQALLAAARAACPALGVSDLLLICEAQSADGVRFATAASTGLRFAEHHMERDAELAGAPTFSTPRLDIQAATHGDVDALIRVLRGAFGRVEERERERVERALRAGRSRYYLARQAGEPVGVAHVIPLEARTGIYGFGVAPEQQGRGIGRAFLSQLMGLLHAQGATCYALEVETTNAAAQAVYRACGFTTTTTYGYYAVAV
jgi:ribosomal protein S18 acetylase RimI-like enzyme